MNELRKYLEDLFEKADIETKIKDITNFFGRGIDQVIEGIDYYGRNNPIMDFLGELIGSRTAYADTLPQSLEDNKVNSLDVAQANKVSSQPLGIKDRYASAIETLRPKIIGFEGNVPHIYLDTKGNITSGVGYNVDNKDIFMNIPWKNQNRFATQEEKETAYNKFMELKREKKYGKNVGAGAFKKYSPLTMDEDMCTNAMDKHVQKAVEYLDKRYPWFRNLSPERQAAIIDIHYNTGKFTKDEFPKFIEAAERNDFAEMAKQSHRKDIQKKRNDTIYQWLMGK